MDWGFGGTGMIFMMFFMFLFFVLIVGGTILIFWWFASQSKTERSSKSSAMDILNERYAKGDISKEEYQEKKKELS